MWLTACFCAAARMQRIPFALMGVAHFTCGAHFGLPSPYCTPHKCVRGVWNCLESLLARRCRMRRVIKHQSHRHDARPAHRKGSNLGQCVVVRWVCVTRRYSCVERAGPTLCIRRRSFCASGFLSMHKKVRGARRMNVQGRQRCAERAGPTPDTRGAHAGHTLGIRCVFVDWGLAHT